MRHTYAVASVPEVPAEKTPGSNIWQRLKTCFLCRVAQLVMDETVPTMLRHFGLAQP